jgi:hypothetical protein
MLQVSIFQRFGKSRDLKVAATDALALVAVADASVLVGAGSSLR